MDVDIDVGRIDADEQHVKGIASGYQQFFVSVHDCMMQVSVPDVAIIDEKILLTAGFFGVAGFSGETMEADDIRFFFHRHQAFSVGMPEYVDNPLFQCGFGKMKNFLSVMVQRKEQLRM